MNYNSLLKRVGFALAMSSFVTPIIIGIMYIEKYDRHTGIKHFGGGVLSTSILAFVLIFSTVFYSTRRRKIAYICPKCEDVRSTTSDSAPICFTCGVSMEKLQGFYERREKEKGDTDE